MATKKNRKPAKQLANPPMTDVEMDAFIKKQRGRVIKHLIIGPVVTVLFLLPWIFSFENETLAVKLPTIYFAICIVAFLYSIFALYQMIKNYRPNQKAEDIQAGNGFYGLMFFFGGLAGICYFTFSGNPQVAFIMNESDPGVLLWGVLLIMLIPFMVWMTMREPVVSMLEQNVIPYILKGVFPDMVYKPIGGKLKTKAVLAAGFKVSPEASFTWDDYVKATYKGVQIEFGDITLKEYGDNESKDNNEIFKGLWFICSFDKELATDLRIHERKVSSKIKIKGDGVQTDSTAFNKKFNIQTENPQEAFYILTPHVMEYFLATEKSVEGKMNIIFSRAGQVHIAIDSGRDAFELGTLFTNVASLRKRFTKEVKYVTDMVDELLAIKTLFRENTKKH